VTARVDRRRLLAGLSLAALAGYGLVHHLGRTWGTTPGERHRHLIGDEVVATPRLQTTHAVTIAAPPAEVWPWLVQMGYHRGGWYTYEWVDHYLFHMSNPSADHIVDDLQTLAVGDLVPDGEPGTAWYVVDRLEAPRHLVLHSTTHIPPAWRTAHPDAWIDWTWAFVLEPRDDGGTRLLVRVRGDCGPWWMRVVFVGGVVPADFVMSRSMLLGIKRRAERRVASVRAPGTSQVA
jgi:hypothetical protein